MNYASNLALVSIFLYASLAITCLYFALCFYDYKAGELVRGRYSAPKFAFFSVLCVSAVLDIPLFVGCIAENGPGECEWGTASFWVFWLFHVIATCGYVYDPPTWRLVRTLEMHGWVVRQRRTEAPFCRHLAADLDTEVREEASEGGT